MITKQCEALLFRNVGLLQPNVLVAELTTKTNYDADDMETQVAEDEPRSFQGERKNFVRILSSVNFGAVRLFHLDAPGGSGEIFLINLRLTNVPKHQVVASSDTAAIGYEPVKRYIRPANFHWI